MSAFDTPPHSIEAEEITLGGVMAAATAGDSEATEYLRRAIAIVGDSDAFYVAEHRRIFSALLSVVHRGALPETMAIAEELHRLGELQAAGGPVLLQRLVSSAPTIGNLLHFARIVHEQHTARRLLRHAGDITKAVHTGMSPTEVINRYGDLSGINGAGHSAIEHLDLAAIAERGIPPVDWLWPGWLARRDTGLLAASPGSGKSTTAAVIAQSLARGIPCFGITIPRAVRVLVVDQEQSPEEVADIYLRTGGAHENLRVIVGQGLTIDSSEGLARLKRELADFRPELVILDSAQQVFVANLSDNDEVAARYRVLHQLRDEYDVAFLVIAHEPKPSRESPRKGLYRVFGAVAFTSQSSTVWIADSPAGGVMDLAQEKRRRSKKLSLRITYREEGPERRIVLEAEGPVEVQETVLERAAAFITGFLEHAGGPAKRARILDAAKREGFAENKVDAALAHLGKIRVLVKPDGTRGTYMLARALTTAPLELDSHSPEAPF